MRDRLAELLTSAFEESGMTIRELAISVRGGDDESSIKRVRERLEAKVLNLEELVQISKTLRISPDALMRALFPDLPNDRSLILQQRNAELRALQFESELAAMRAGGLDVSLLREIAGSTRWAVSVLPHVSGPTQEAEVVTGIRLAVTLTHPETMPPDASARSLFVAEFGRVIQDRAWFLAPSVRPLPAPTTPSRPEDVVYLQVPMFSRDRMPSQIAVPLPHLHRESVLFVAVSQAAWCPNVAAVAARALGWGLENSASVGRAVAPILVPERDRYIEAVNKIKNDSLRSLLADCKIRTVVHHSGRGVVGDDGEEIEQHALISMLNDEILSERTPFVVLLSESDAMMRHQALKVRRFDTKESRFTADRWIAWRDELRTAVSGIEPLRRGVVLDVDFPIGWDDDGTPPDDVVHANRMQWQRTAGLAGKAIDRLMQWGAVGPKRGLLPNNLDPEAQKILKTLDRYN